jgi:hypothetical protein
MTLGPGNIEGDFNCDPNADPYPFKCSDCGHVMVYCVECNTLFPDLHRLEQYAPTNSLDSSRPAFACPRCAHVFEFSFLRNRAYRVTRDDMIRAGLQHLLVKQ